MIKYRKFLEWEIVSQPRSTRLAERALAPVLGKSAVHYATKSSSNGTPCKGRT